MPATQWNDDEHYQLRGKTMLAQLIYLRVFRKRMDYRTGVSGGPGRKITNQAIREEVGFVPDRGSTRELWAPGNEEIRAAIRELQRPMDHDVAPLLVDMGSSRHHGYVKKHPWATLDKSVQNMNPTRTPLEPHCKKHTENPAGSTAENASNSAGCEAMNPAENAAGNHASYPQGVDGMNPTPPVSDICLQSNSQAQSGIPRARVDGGHDAGLCVEERLESFRDVFGELGFEYMDITAVNATLMLAEWANAGVVTADDIRSVVKALRDAGRPFKHIAYLRGPMADWLERRAMPGKVSTTYPAWAKMPKADDRLWPWAQEHGYPDPGQRTNQQYRSLLRSCIDRRLGEEGLA